MANFIPEGWALQKIGDFATVVNVRNKHEKAVPVLSVTKYDGFVRSLDYFKKQVFSRDTSTYKLVYEGQFAYSTIHLDEGSLGLLEEVEVGQVSPMYTVFKTCSGIDRIYFYNLLKSDEFMMLYPSLGQGSIDRRASIPFGVLADVSFRYPPLPEQQKIATILSSVDDVIEKTRAQIDKLKDLKTGMMQELLTKGIGHTEFKDSPVGRIPASWSVVPLDSVVSTIESGWSPQCESNPARSGEWAILKTTAVTWSGFDFRANKKLPEQLEPRPAIQVESHDILITRAGPSERVGVVSYVTYVPSKIMLSDKLIRIKANQDQNPQFLSFWLSTEFVRNFFAQRTTGLAQSQTNISQEILKSVPCAIPPLAEQNVISNAIAALERELNLKREILQHKKSLKKALMQDLLTGKVRVKLTSKESAAS